MALTSLSHFQSNHPTFVEGSAKKPDQIRGVGYCGRSTTQMTRAFSNVVAIASAVMERQDILAHLDITCIQSYSRICFHRRRVMREYGGKSMIPGRWVLTGFASGCICGFVAQTYLGNEICCISVIVLSVVAVIAFAAIPFLTKQITEQGSSRGFGDEHLS